ncbi:hypothetical protein SAMN05421854_1081 [Amycolatopsis rubida]|uniref:Uncharacterized protein n=1 Tax=Amycolatopsis rubida TaxID=112413 RepID=A0A1I5ULN2_9PSEU|nr:hypothetical protein SAMN05421854_1081 [Amycolatopsis rubida]
MVADGFPPGPARGPSVVRVSLAIAEFRRASGFRVRAAGFTRWMQLTNACLVPAAGCRMREGSAARLNRSCGRSMANGYGRVVGPASRFSSPRSQALGSLASCRPRRAEAVKSRARGWTSPAGSDAGTGSGPDRGRLPGLAGLSGPDSFRRPVPTRSAVRLNRDGRAGSAGPGQPGRVSHASSATPGQPGRVSHASSATPGQPGQLSHASSATPAQPRQLSHAGSAGPASLPPRPASEAPSGSGPRSPRPGAACRRARTNCGPDSSASGARRRARLGRSGRLRVLAHACLCRF